MNREKTNTPPLPYHQTSLEWIHCSSQSWGKQPCAQHICQGLQDTVHISSPTLTLHNAVPGISLPFSSFSALNKVIMHWPCILKNQKHPHACCYTFFLEISSLGGSIESVGLLVTFRETSPTLLPLALPPESFLPPDWCFPLQAQQMHPRLLKKEQAWRAQ